MEVITEYFMAIGIIRIRKKILLLRKVYANPESSVLFLNTYVMMLFLLKLLHFY